MRKLLNSAGDTIVEVMLALAVLSMVIGGAYAASGRSLRQSQQAQERSEALKIAEDQIEKLKAAYGIGVELFNSPTPATFCINSTTLQPVGVSIGPGIPLPTECQVNTGGDFSYEIYVNRSSSDQATAVFTFTCQWPRAGGGEDNVTITYRL